MVFILIVGDTMYNTHNNRKMSTINAATIPILPNITFLLIAMKHPSL